MKKTIIAIAVCALAFCLAGCSGAAKADREFLNAIETSVTTRMANSGTDDRLGLVNNELAALEKYRGVEFSDPVLTEAAEDYLKGLDLQKEALGSTEMYWQYQSLWNEGLVLRYGALNSLYESYGFMEDNTEFVADYILGYETHKAWLDAFNAIEADISAQVEADEIKYDYSSDGHEIRITLMNNTEYSFETVWELDIIDEDGTVKENTQGVVKAQPNAKYVVTAYVSNPGDYYSVNWNNWYSEIYV